MLKGIFCYTFSLLRVFSLRKDLPVKSPVTEGFDELNYSNVRNLYSVDMLYRAIKNGDNNGLKLDLSGIDKLLDGSAINPNNIYGTIYVGPYPLNLQRRDMNIKDLGVSQVLKMVWAPLILHRY